MVGSPPPARVLLKAVREEFVSLTAQRGLQDGGRLSVTQLEHNLKLVVKLRPGKLGRGGGRWGEVGGGGRRWERWGRWGEVGEVGEEAGER